MDLKSVGLGLGCVPFHSGWELVECRPKLVDLGENCVEILSICDEIEEKELEVFGLQIELDLGEGSSIHDLGEPLVEVAGVAPTMVEVEDDGDVHVVEVIKDDTPVEKETGDLAVHEVVGTGDEPVLESVKERIGAKPVLKTMDMRTGDVPVLTDVEMGIGDMLVHEMEMGDSHFEDYPRENFKKVGDFTHEETPQTPAEPVPAIPSEETPSSTEPRRKRIKMLAGRTDLPWVQKLIA